MAATIEFFETIEAGDPNTESVLYSVEARNSLLMSLLQYPLISLPWTLQEPVL